MKIVEIENAGVPAKYQPGMISLQDDNGVIFVTAMLHPAGETGAVLCASYDGTPMAEYRGHVYAPLEWLRGEVNPDGETIATLETIERRAAPEFARMSQS